MQKCVHAQPDDSDVTALVQSIHQSVVTPGIGRMHLGLFAPPLPAKPEACALHCHTYIHTLEQV